MRVPHACLLKGVPVHWDSDPRKASFISLTLKKNNVDIYVVGYLFG